MTAWSLVMGDPFLKQLERKVPDTFRDVTT